MSVQDKSIKIYLNEKLEIDTKADDGRFRIKSNRIDLFKEIDSSKNTTNDDTLRISLKSITYLNRSIKIDQWNSLTSIAPPFYIIASNLISMGYKNSWIESIIKQYQTMNISTIHGILYEQKQQLKNHDFENQQTRYFNILSKFDPSIDSNVLKNLIHSSKFDSNSQIIDFAQNLFSYWMLTSSSCNYIDNKTELTSGKLSSCFAALQK